MKTSVVMLSINAPSHLVELSISSILHYTSSSIVVGVINDDETRKYPQDSRISFVKLSSIERQSPEFDKDTTYINFTDDAFFDLVEYKWILFQQVLMKVDSDLFIYLDLDVVVLRDCVSVIEEMLEENSEIDFFVQDATSSPLEPLLCMGFFAFRNSNKSRDLFDTAKQLHSQENRIRGRFGDDEVMTTIYRTQRQEFSIALLPQQSFPVGVLGRLWFPFGLIRGLKPTIPYIFHANYMVGSLRKAAAMEFFFRLSKKGRSTLGAALVLWLNLLKARIYDF